ncbi:MAG: aspartate aminotransferase family protein [Chlorobium sp.]|nr:aspartate aminotransferase family protein [Chlorobium sp.]
MANIDSVGQNNKTKSELLYQRGCKVMPGGVSRNTVLRSPHPLYAEKGEGCYVTDIEGVRRIDFANNMAALIHGHAHPEVVEAVTQQLHKGTAFTLATEAEVRYAEYLCSRNPGFEMIRFVNSGTEAVMSCLKAARAFTGRHKIAKAEGAYHGLYDYAEVSQTASPANWGPAESPVSVPVSHGTPLSALNDVVVIPFNNPELAIEILNKHANELACVLIDLMPHRIGLSPATAEFVRALRKWTNENGALLVYDEVITFRSNFGGAQQWYDVCPDLTAMGKMIGGGFPVGALAGRNDVMEVMNPLVEKIVFSLSGTFSANPITMTAGRVTMELFDQVAVERLNKLADRARSQIAEAIRIVDIPACISGAGSMFRVHMKPDVSGDYRRAYVTPKESKLTKYLLDHLFDNGIMMINTCSGTLSTVMTDKEIDVLSEVMLSGFRKIKELQL